MEWHITRASNHEILKTAKWLLRYYTSLNIQFMCWNYRKMFYWCHLNPPHIFWLWLQDRDELVPIAKEKAMNKEVGNNLWRWSSLSPLVATGNVSSEAKANFIKRWGMGHVHLGVERTLYHYRLHQCLREKKGWSIHSTAGAHSKAGYLAEWNQMARTSFNRWNHRGQELHSSSRRSCGR